MESKKGCAWLSGGAGSQLKPDPSQLLHCNHESNSTKTLNKCDKICSSNPSLSWDWKSLGCLFKQRSFSQIGQHWAKISNGGLLAGQSTIGQVGLH